MPARLVVLGSTGSIGCQTLDVAREFPDRIAVHGLATLSNIRSLRGQISEFGPALVTIGRGDLRDLRSDTLEVLPWDRGMVDMVTRPEVDIVVVATGGGGGLLPTLSALRAGKLVALANKETLVMAGSLIREAANAGRGQLVPIDSEHSAIWQCLQGEPHRSVEQLTLTASGGALRHLTASQEAEVTPEQALQHPTWSMGPKITIDSANLMNKGLEAIEARWIFDLPQERINVLLHPQSIVHSLVTFDDGSTKAQLGLPDMRLPIQYALSHPERWSNTMTRLDLASVGDLTFASVDLQRYPALRLALQAGGIGGTAPAVLCGADEVAVEAFLAGKIRFTEIPVIVEGALATCTPCQFPELEDILSADRWARETANRLVARLGK